MQRDCQAAPRLWSLRAGTALAVSDVMTSELVTALEQDTVETALKRMHEHGVRRLPSVNGTGALVGLLTRER